MNTLVGSKSDLNTLVEVVHGKIADGVKDCDK